MPFMFQKEKMAASVVRLFVSLRSLRGVKSGGHWSESPSHWLFLYVKPFNVALQRYHEAYFTSRLFPPGEISSRLRGLPRYTHVPWHRCQAWKQSTSQLSASWLGPHEYQSFCCFCVAGTFLTPAGAVNCLFRSEVSVSNQTTSLELTVIA